MNLISASNFYVLIWLIITVVMILAELATVSLLTIWFAAGAAAALIFALIGVPFAIQVLVFVIVSVVILALVRPFAKKYVNGRAPKTNADRVIGARAIVTEAVNNLHQSGRAVVLGQDWSIRTEDDRDRIPVGALVEVIRISGAKLIVKAVKEE